MKTIEGILLNAVFSFVALIFLMMASSDRIYAQEFDMKDKLFFNAIEEDGEYSLYSVNSKGEELQCYGKNAYFPSWDNKGEQLAYLSVIPYKEKSINNNTYLKIVGLDKSEKTFDVLIYIEGYMPFSAIRKPAWSVDNKKIAVLLLGQAGPRILLLKVINIVTGETKEIICGKYDDGEVALYADIEWRDNDNIIFSSPQGISIVNIKEKEPTNWLYKNTELEQKLQNTYVAKKYRDNILCVLPDLNKKIYSVINVNPLTKEEIYVGELEHFPQIINISNDNLNIYSVFQIKDSGNYDFHSEVVEMNISNKEKYCSKIGEDNVFLSSPAFSPDAKKIFCIISEATDKKDSDGKLYYAIYDMGTKEIVHVMDVKHNDEVFGWMMILPKDDYVAWPPKGE